LDIITKAEANSAIGITRAAGNTQNTRLFGKNLGQTTGSIFLFKPNLITANKIPADKNAGDINGKTVFSIEGRVMDAIKPYMDASVADSNTGTGLKPISQKTTKVFTQVDGDAYNWYTEFSANYMTPIINKIGKSEVPISTSSKVTPIFWDFMVVAPLGFNVAYDQSSGNEIYSQKLRDAITRLLGEAGKIDPAYASVDASILSKYLFEDIVNAMLVLCLNKGILVKSNLENNFVPVAIEKPMQGAKKAAVGMQAGSPANSPSSGTSNASTVTATAGFDGTAINNEMDLAKVISGTWIGYGTKPNEVDSLDKVKTVYNEWLKKLPSAAVTTFDEIKAKLPFTKSDAALISTKEFNALQYFIVNTQDKPYGPQTEAAVKAGFEKSSIK
jgi:hypothetical protein